jgi:predicted amidohydrolase
MERLVSRAADQGAIYVQTPEMTGILEKNPESLLNQIASQEEDPVFATAARLAEELGIWLHLGSTAILLPNTAQTGKVANRGAIFSPDGVIASIYDKIHMFDVDVDPANSWRESNRYQAGSRAVIVTMDGVKTGMSICYDIRFPQLYRHQAKLGAAILTCPAAFTKPTGQAHWEILLRARAIENGAYMIAAAQGGIHEDGRGTHGHSMVVDPWGRIVGQLDHDREEVLVCDIDLSKVEEARHRIPNLVNEQKFSIFEA